jgi:DNA-binding response OmpR family regulator
MADNVNRLLIVEQDAAVVDLVGKVAKEAGYAVASAESGASFVQLLDSFQPSLVVMAPNLPDTDGVELLTSLATRVHGQRPAAGQRR